MDESLLVSSLNHRSLNLPGGAPEGTDARLIPHGGKGDVSFEASRNSYGHGSS